MSDIQAWLHENDDSGETFDEKMDRLLESDQILHDLCEALGIQTTKWARLKRAPELARIKIEKIKLKRDEFKVELEIARDKGRRR